MYEGSQVSLKMEKIISADAIFDEETHRCQVFRYDMEEDYIYLKLKEEDLTALSLDARYLCYISAKNEQVYCTGVIKERFQSEEGNMIIFKISNGFYSVQEQDRTIN